MNRRELAAALLGTLAWPAYAQDRNIVRIMVPYPAGGNADNIARLFADGLRKKLEKMVIVENKPGAGAIIGAEAAARSPNDGSVLFIAPTAVFVVTPHLKPTPYDAQTDFVPIAKLTSWIPVMVVRKDFPANDFAGVVSELKKNPGKYMYGSAGVATMTHLMGEMMNQKLGVDTMHVPYKGSSDFISDLLGGRIDMVYDSVVVPQVKAGELKAVASMVEMRHPDLPSVPTLKELGTDLATPNWYGLFAPKGTPQEMVDRLGAASKEVVQTLDREKLTNMSMEPAYQGPAEFKAQIVKDDQLMREVIKTANVKLD